MNKYRLEALSDGVFVVAITLLVLDIRLRPGVAYEYLGGALLQLGPKILSYLLSFIVVGVDWSFHHAALASQRRPRVRRSALRLLSKWTFFLDAYVDGWGAPQEAREDFKANVRAWLSEPDWWLYLARIDGRPAAVAILFLHDGVAYFVDAATAPSLRRQGQHAALLSRRWQDATAARVEFVCGAADYLSTNHPICRPITATWSDRGCGCSSREQPGRHWTGGFRWAARAPERSCYCRRLRAGVSLPDHEE